MSRRNNPTQQLSLDFEPGLSRKFRSLRRVTAQLVYQHGLDRCAIAADESPGNFSKSLGDRDKGDTSARRFDLDALEAVMEETGDFSPIYYLIDKYLQDESAKKQQALAALSSLLPDMQRLMKAAGL